MENLEQINYTLIEPQNTYRSDIYSPWQTKLQLEIWQEVNPEKVKTWSKLITWPWTYVIDTKSKNSVIRLTAVELWQMKESQWEMIWQMRKQEAWKRDWSVRYPWYIYYFDDNTYWKITKLSPWRFEIETKWQYWAYITYEAHNLSL